jgi:hypothetical protein
VESRLGDGSTFTLDLPLDGPVKEADEAKVGDRGRPA